MQKNRLKQTLALLGIVWAYSTLNAQTSDELKQKIEQINREMIKALIDGNIEKSLSFYSENAISMPNNGNIIEGKEAIKRSTLELSANGTKISMFEVNTLYLFNCDDKIIEVGKFKTNYTAFGVSEIYEETGKYLTVWHKEADGNLKIQIEAWNSDSKAN